MKYNLLPFFTLYKGLSESDAGAASMAGNLRSGNNAIAFPAMQMLSSSDDWKQRVAHDNRNAVLKVLSTIVSFDWEQVRVCKAQIFHAFLYYHSTFF